MEGPPLGPGGEDITWPDQVAPWGRKASSKPQTSNRLVTGNAVDFILANMNEFPISSKAILNFTCQFITFESIQFMIQFHGVQFNMIDFKDMVKNIEFELEFFFYI